MFTFKQWISNLFPKYYHDNDTMVNSDGKGFFMRYVETYGEELDEQFYPFIRDFMNLFDTINSPDRLLGNLSFILGMPPSVDNNFTVYRYVLAYAVKIYKIKGTLKSFQLLFQLLGLQIKIQEDEPGGQVQYDAGFFYDDGRFYDVDCDNCSKYYILYYDPLNPLAPVPNETLEKFNNVLCFLNPVNAIFGGYIRTLFIEDEFDLTIQDTTIGFNVAQGGFSDGFSGGFQI